MSSLLVLTATSQNYSGKVLKILRTFLSRPRPRLFFSRPRPRLWVPRPRLYFCPRGASRPRPWSRGLHHCV